MVGEERECERKGCAYLLRILLNKNFVLRLDLCCCLILQYDSRRKTDEKGRRCDYTDNIFSDFCGRLRKDAVFETSRRE